MAKPALDPAPPQEEEELSSLTLEPAERHPRDVREIPLAEIAEIENSRPEYYGIEEMARNLHTQGQLEPCLVRPAAPEAEHGKPYELVYGYRRKRAAEHLGWETLRCEIRELSDAEVLERQLSENFGREDLSPIAEANAMRRMMKMQRLSQAEVARRLGCHPSHVSHRLSLLGLKEEIIDKVDAGLISASAAEVIASLDDAAAQSKVTELAVRNDWGLKKIQKWVREAKAAQNSAALERVSEEKALDRRRFVQTADVVDLPRLELPDDLPDDMVQRLVLYALLRNGNDTEMLEYIADELGFEFERLWDYVSALESTQVLELTARLATRYVCAAHRYPTLPESLKRAFADRQEATGDG